MGLSGNGDCPPKKPLSLPDITCRTSYAHPMEFPPGLDCFEDKVSGGEPDEPDEPEEDEEPEEPEEPDEDEDEDWTFHGWFNTDV